MTKFCAIALFAIAGAAGAQPLTPVATRDQKIIKRWELPGDPHGVAVGADGTIYAGLAKPQAVVAIDPKSGTIKKKFILDSAEIASTKELVTMRINRAGTRLYIANGSDESATIMSIPDLAVLREITMEGEAIRDAVPDPKGRYLYLLGRHVHVFDINGEKELRTISIDDPMAIAPSANGSLLAVVAPEDFGNTKATSVAFFDTTNFAEAAREPLQTDKVIEAMAGQTFKAPSGITSKMDEKNHHLHKAVFIGEIKADGQFNVVWKTPGPVKAKPWSPYIAGNDVKKDEPEKK